MNHYETYSNECLVIKAPPERMKKESIIANVNNNLLNKVILFDIIFKVRQVNALHMSPKVPTIKTSTPEQMKLNLISISSW